MAYRADIEIAVRGAQELKRLQNEIAATSKLVDGLNNYIENIGSGGIVRNINNLKRAVADAASVFNEAALNTEEATLAARKYVTATNDLNTGLRERVQLLKQVADEERRARLASSGIRETTQYAGPIGPGPASPVGSLVGQRSPVEEKLKRTIAARKDEKDLQEALLRLEEKSAEILNRELQARGEIARLSAQGVNAAKFSAAQQTLPLALPAFKERGLKLLDDNVRLNESSLRIEQALNGERARGVRFLEKQSAEEARQVQLGISGQRTNRLPGRTGAAVGQFPTDGPINLPKGFAQSMLPGSQAAARGAFGGVGKRLPGAISGGIIGGAFPLLFGQGGGAAAGGAIGGLVGGLAGPGGSFAGSLLGTLLGDIASRGQAVKQLGQDLGFSAQQAQLLSNAFKTANTDVEKFTAVVQNIRGLGLELQDQAELIKLTTTLTEKYGGQFDKVGNAITSALESGKVSQATLNQLTSQGINIQDALADKLGVSRDKLLEMAKKGQISVQDLVNTLVDVGNKGSQAVQKPATGIEMLGKASKDLGKAIADLGGAIVKSLAPPFNWLAARLSGIISLAAQGVQSIAKLLSGGTQSTAVANARARKLLFEETRGAAPMRGNLTVAQTARLRVLEAQQQKAVAAAEAKIKPINVSGLGQAAPSGGGGSDKAAKDAARLAEQRQKQLEAAARLAVSTDTQLKKAVAINKEEKLSADMDQQRMERMVKYETLYKEALSNAEIEYLLSAQLNEILAEKLNYEQALLDINLEQSKVLNETDPLGTALQEIDLLAAKIAGKEEEYKRQQAINDLVAKGVPVQDAINHVEVIDQLNTKLQEQLALEQLIATAGQGVGNALIGVFDALIARTDNFNEVLTNTLASLGRFLMMAGLNALADMGDPSGKSIGILSFLGFGKRAGGGPVNAGAPYVVGERGPELFVPGANGGVMSNSDLRSTMGSAPGSSSGPVLNMSFETTNIGGVEYVSRDQLEAAMAATRRQAARDGAKRGMDMTLDRLQQSPSTRNRVGLR